MQNYLIDSFMHAQKTSQPIWPGRARSTVMRACFLGVKVMLVFYTELRKLFDMIH